MEPWRKNNIHALNALVCLTLFDVLALMLLLYLFALAICFPTTALFTNERSNQKAVGARSCRSRRSCQKLLPGAAHVDHLHAQRLLPGTMTSR